MARLMAPDIPVNLVSTNVGESGLDEWAADTAYTTGDEVKHTAGQPLPHREYRARIDHTSSADAPPEPDGNAEWIEIGVTNQHRMFDGFNNTPTVADDPSGDLVVEIDIGRRLQSLLLMGLRNVGSLVVEQWVNETLKQTTTLDLSTSRDGVGWWPWLFGERTYARSATMRLEGNYRSQTLKITFSSASAGNAECSQCLVCEDFDLGNTLDNAQPRIKKWSTFRPDAFGNYKFVGRKGTRTGSYTLILDTADVDRVYSIMEDVEERLVALDANNDNTNFDCIRAYGTITDFAPGISYNKTRCDIKIEGIN